jgi:hypothetical protein
VDARCLRHRRSAFVVSGELADEVMDFLRARRPTAVTIADGLPPITPAAELHAQRGTAPASAEDFERLSSDVPVDDEG